MHARTIRRFAQILLRGPLLSLFGSRSRISRMSSVVAAVVAVSCLASVTLPGQATVHATPGGASPLNVTLSAHRRPMPHAVAPTSCAALLRKIERIALAPCRVGTHARQEGEAFDVFAPTLAAFAPHARADSYQIASMW
jgi:hypothetical protein